MGVNLGSILAVLLAVAACCTNIRDSMGSARYWHSVVEGNRGRIVIKDSGR
jgi:hypothetical protein